MSRYKQDIANRAVVSDCFGGCMGYAWTNGDQGVLEAIGTDKSIPSSYGSHGCPDKGANSMFTWAKSKGMDWGIIDTLSEILGLTLYKDGHAGCYIGHGYAVEWQGLSWGCDLMALGNKRLILLGNCGILERLIQDCGIIIPTRAIRDEGTSYHYAKPGGTITVNKMKQR